ncbi:hypothetical protein Misp02_01710 [Microtetraspora sp. NBRC 16547]|nr:hypothetical protein Misp02_01710 [Microtetraspora sp. NBRC 16547]
MISTSTTRALLRYVLPLGKDIPFDRDGFLDLPPEGAWWLGPNAHPRPVTELLDQGGSFVLLAAGGVGKTRVLDDMRAREGDVAKIDLVGAESRDIREAISQAIAEGRPIYLDGLDEAVIYLPALFRILEQCLNKASAGEVPWRLSCRPAAWDATLARRLAEVVPGFRALRLLPLTRAHAVDLAERLMAQPGSIADPAAMVERLGRLASTPGGLHAAIRRWRKTGSLPDGQLEALRFEVEDLLTEVNPSLPTPMVSLDRRYRLASRLGAISLFSLGTGRFSRSVGDQADVVGVSELPSDPEPEEPGTPVTPQEYQEILNTALFDAAPDSTVSFRHHQYAEFLAAYFLVVRKIGRAQLKGVLGVHAEGKLPGAMMGVAAWLGALKPSLIEDLIVGNALGLAQTGVALSSDVRAKIVDSLLMLASTGNIDPWWQIDLSVLSHPDLEAQLRRHLDDAHRAEHLWWIARFAQAGMCRPLVGRLLELAIESQAPSWARGALVEAVGALGTDQDRVALHAFLTCDEIADPDDDLLAKAFAVLYPNQMSCQDLLGKLRPRRNRQLVGSYLIFLGGLAERLPADDVPTALAWASRHLDDAQDAYGRLFSQLLARGCSTASRRDIAEALAGFLADLLNHPAWSREMYRDGMPWHRMDAEQRRLLAVKVANRLTSDAWYRLYRSELIQADDLLWLIKELTSLPKPAQEALAECVSVLSHQPTAATAELILSLEPDHPAYPLTEHLRQPMAIDCHSAQQWRRARDSETVYEQRRSTAASEQEANLRTAIDEAETNTESWWKIIYWISLDPHQSDHKFFAHDLTTRPGWQRLDEMQRDRVLEIGLDYVKTHQVNASEWAGRDSFTLDQVLPDWSGVHLMTSLAQRRSELLQVLEPSVWKCWAPAIVGAWIEDHQEDGIRTRADLFDMAPDKGQQAILAAALDFLDDLQTHGSQLSFYPLYKHIADRLASDVAERLVADRYDDHLAAALLRLLTEKAPNVATATCRQLRSNPSSMQSIVASQCLAELDPSSIVDSLCAGESDLEGIGPYLKIEALDEPHLSALARLILDRFSYADDTSASKPWGIGRDIRQTRQAVLQQMTDLGLVEELESLKEGRPLADSEIVAWYLRTARSRVADLALTRPTPPELLVFLARSDTRLIRHGDNLQTVVLEQLHLMQHEITHNTAFRDLWNETKQGDSPKGEDDISDWIRRAIEVHLTNGCVIDREIQVARRASKGFGTRIDLTATATAATQAQEVVRVIIEAKLVGNDELLTAMHQQLKEKYLIPMGVNHGIYLVYWVAPEQRPAGWSRRKHPDLATLMNQLREQAQQIQPPLSIQPFVLDISRPAPF